MLRLFASAERNLADAGLSELSNDNRFDAAYKTIMQCAIVGQGPITRRWVGREC